MDAAKLNQLKHFIEQCKSNPSTLSDPSLSFFRDYLESLGAKLPPAAYGHGDQKSKSYAVDESDEDMDDIENEPRTDPSVDEGYESDVNESDIELEGETVEPDNDPPQKMGDPSIEVTEENRDASQAAKAQAMEALSEGSMVVVYVILLFVDRLCRAYWFVIIQVSLRKQLSILLRPFLSIQLLPLCMQPELASTSR